MSDLVITEDTIVAHSLCLRKAYRLLFRNDHGEDQKYTEFIKKRRSDLEKTFFRSENNHLPFSLDKLMGKAEIITNASLRQGNLVVQQIHLQKREPKSRLGNYSYEPLIFSFSVRIKPQDRINAAYIGDIISRIQGARAQKATILLIDGSKKSIKLSNDIHVHILHELQDWVTSKPEIPSIIFNKHCPLCPFEESCKYEAEKDDSISLLGNITKKALKKYESKGIFTIKQLSYLYKPRRRSHHWGDRKPRHEYELQALALRTKKIYTNDTTVPPAADVEIFLDIESAPEQRFHYLIGVFIWTDESQKYLPLWADTLSDEKCIWEQFIEITKQYATAPIFHYGSYEKKVIRELGTRYNCSVDNICNRLFNVNTYIFGRIYFPTRTNGLKDICNYLGFKWTSAVASGLNSIIWRYEYDKTHESEIRDDLLTYNNEDCVNLKRLKDVIHGICHGSERSDVAAADDQNQLLNATSSRVVKELEVILESAHGVYEQSKLSLKKARNKSSSKRKQRSHSSRHAISKSKIDKVVRVPRGRICPVHKRPLLPTNETAEHIIIDLVCTPKGIKRVITKYYGEKGRCPNCSRRHHPPGLRKLGKHQIYGAGLIAWVAYQRLAMRLPFNKISQLAEDTFNIWIASGGIHTLFKALSSRYLKTEKLLLKKLLESPKIHVDETLVNIQGKLQYVWVFTDGEHVIFRLTPTRESSIVHQILEGYEGLLVSDFFAGYDAVKCRQQKCWVHLIRDMNDDLRKSPFDLEFERFVLALRDVLIPIFDVVEKYGLKKCHLNKFKKSVDKFYKFHILEAHYKSDTTNKYQKRFVRYSESLFVFLESDGIPWNNNMAERALRHLAVQRKISGSFFASSMTQYLILLGITQTCRFQNKPLLEFLMSGEKDIDQFKGKKDIRGWQMK
jgi:predicted RecB family nuclease